MRRTAGAAMTEPYHWDEDPTAQDVIDALRMEPEVCSSCFGSGVERWDHGLGERCSLCKGRGV